MAKKSKKSKAPKKAKAIKKHHRTPQEQCTLALGQCTAEMDGAFRKIRKELETKVTASPSVIASFVQEFDKDFLLAFTDTEHTPPSETFPGNAWALTRTQVMLKVRAIATLAMSYALGAKASAIARDHLAQAARTVKPDCTITTHSPHRLDYCAGWGGKTEMSPTGIS